MITYLKEFSKNALGTSFNPFGMIATILGFICLKGMVALAHEPLIEQFPIASFILLVVNTFLWFCFLSSFLTIKEDNWKYFSITIGSFAAIAFQMVCFLFESTGDVRKIPYSSNELITMGYISLLVAAIPIILSHLEKKQTLKMALEVEEQKPEVQEDLTLHLRNYRDMLNMDIRNEVSNVYYLYERLKKESLSIEEHHVLSRSKKEFHKVLDKYMELHYNSQKEIQPTILAILNDIKQEAQRIFDKKEEEKMNDIKRVLTLRKEKTTY